MKNILITLTITSLVIMVWISQIQAKMAVKNEAYTVAKNWIDTIIRKNGDWGGYKTAEVAELQIFVRENRDIGYFCRVEPVGFIVISLYKELAPVKAYSATCNLISGCNDGLTDVIKDGMVRIIKTIEQQVGSVQTARTETVKNILEVNYCKAWQTLMRGSIPINQKHNIESMNMDSYNEGQVLLSSAWHQGAPYNNYCRIMDCSSTENGRSLVGCVATAGAQLMRYWSWPPYGQDLPNNNEYYDWPNMPDKFYIGSSPHVQVDAVARLCHDVGLAVGMNYGCENSTAFFASYWDKDLYNALIRYNFNYSDKSYEVNRNEYCASDWFDLIKKNINENRPLPYRLDTHVVVVDGWQEVGDICYYHINYGFGKDNDSWEGGNTWYALDEIYGGNPYYEQAIINLRPTPFIGCSMESRRYKRNESFSYRYFDQDATGQSSLFEAGQYLQFLPGIKVTCTSTGGGSIAFEGSKNEKTYIFTKAHWSRGVRISSGQFSLYQNGSVKLY